MKQFEEFELSTEAINSVVGGLKRKERRAERRRLRRLLSEDKSTWDFVLIQSEDGSISEKLQAPWKGYDGGIIQYYNDFYVNLPEGILPA